MSPMGHRRLQVQGCLSSKITLLVSCPPPRTKSWRRYWGLGSEQCWRWAGYIIFSHFQQWQLSVRGTVRVMGRVGPDCGSYFYFRTLAKCISEWLKIKPAKLQCYRWNHDLRYTRPCYLPELLKNFMYAQALKNLKSKTVMTSSHE